MPLRSCSVDWICLPHRLRLAGEDHHRTRSDELYRRTPSESCGPRPFVRQPNSPNRTHGIMKLAKLFCAFLFMILVPPCASLRAQGNTWTTGVPMPTNRFAPAAATINNILYVVGGVTDTGAATSIVEAYDPVVNAWASRSPLPTPRGRLAAGVINGTMYAVGGFGGETAVEAYDPLTD